MLVGLLVICLAQTSCGFRLRGMVNISPELLPIAVTADGIYIQLTSVLTQTLQGAGLTVVEPAVANSILHLRSERYEKQLLTVATSGESQTYSLQYRVQFKIERSAQLLAKMKQRADQVEKNDIASALPSQKKMTHYCVL